MSSPQCRALLAAIALPLAAGAQAQGTATRDLASTMIEQMGGRAALEGIETIVRSGSGTRTRLGQMPEVGAPDPTAELVEITETIDLANGRSAFDYEVSMDGFLQQRTEVLTAFNGTPVGWATGEGRPNIVTSTDGLFSWATQNSPEWLLRRNVISVALAAANAPAGQQAEERDFNGRRVLYGTTELPLTGEEIGLYFNADSGLLEGFSALDTESMLGDVEAQYVLADYRPTEGRTEGPADGDTGGLTLPHSLTILKDGAPYATATYASITVNDSSALDIFDVPADVQDQASEVAGADGSWAPLRLEMVAPNVHHAIAFSHNSMVVEYPDFVAVVEAPYTQAQSLTLARLIDEQLGKPIRYVVPTHPHYDHVGGVRALAALGATVVVAAGHEAEMRRIVESPQTNPPDELARRRGAGEAVGEVEVFERTITIEDGGQRLVLYEVPNFEHMRPMVLPHLPAPRVVFQSDLYFGAPTPDAEMLLRTIQEGGLAVETIVPGHGQATPFSQLVRIRFQ